MEIFHYHLLDESNQDARTTEVYLCIISKHVC